MYKLFCLHPFLNFKVYNSNLTIEILQDPNFLKQFGTSDK